MPEFISEPITPVGPLIEARAMARGEPGLPAAFTWQDRRVGIVRCTARWKQSGHEVGNARGQIYLRRHYFNLLMEEWNDVDGLFRAADAAFGIAATTVVSVCRGAGKECRMSNSK